MNRENMINILEKVSDKSDLCYINSKTKYSLGLSYVIKYNEKFLMIADTCDYEYDGYVIVKWENIEEIEYNERAIFESKIIKNENGKPNIVNVIDIKLDSYKTIFNYFLDKNENITIYCDNCSEKYVDEDTTTALNIGKIIEVKDDYILFKRFDGVGKWYPENKIYYSDISEILFGDRYTRIMSKYTHNWKGVLVW